MPWRKQQLSKSRRVQESQNNALSKQARLEQLRHQFAKFRKEHPAQSRIPDTLRQAALSAIQQGITRIELQNTCHLTSRQLELWQKNGCTRSEHADSVRQDARIFSVVNNIPETYSKTTSGAQEQNLELRIGGWSICIRQVVG